MSMSISNLTNVLGPSTNSLTKMVQTQQKKFMLSTLFFLLIGSNSNDDWMIGLCVE